MKVAAPTMDHTPTTTNAIQQDADRDLIRALLKVIDATLPFIETANASMLFPHAKEHNDTLEAAINTARSIARSIARDIADNLEHSVAAPIQPPQTPQP